MIPFNVEMWMVKCMILVPCLIILLSGCATVGDFGKSIKYQVQGEYYLQRNDLGDGLSTFSEAVKIDPNSPEAHYYYGRFLLAKNDNRKALAALKKATQLAKDKSEFQFWLGVAYGESGQTTQEYTCYKKALALDAENVQALTYMGNNRLQVKKYTDALAYYDRALALSDYNLQALYNKALCLRKLGRTPEEKKALLNYLSVYPSGSLACRATDRLNYLGDTSYRNHQLGLRKLTLTRIDFQPLTSELSARAQRSLDLVGSTVANMPKGNLNIVVYQMNNRQLAKARAISIRDYLAKNFSELKKSKRIHISWFSVPEHRIVLGKKINLKESVQFFLTDFT